MRAGAARQIDLSSSNENIRKKNLEFSTKKECFLEESGLANFAAVFCIFASLLDAGNAIYCPV